jgi:hypothetical protein
VTELTSDIAVFLLNQVHCCSEVQASIQLRAGTCLLHEADGSIVSTSAWQTLVCIMHCKSVISLDMTSAVAKKGKRVELHLIDSLL